MSFSYVYRKPSTELPVARFAGLLSKVEECCISAGNTSLDCQNVYSKVWFPGAMGGMAIVCLLRDSGLGPARHLIRVYPRGLYREMTFFGEKPPVSHWVNLISIHFRWAFLF